MKEIALDVASLRFAAGWVTQAHLTNGEVLLAEYVTHYDDDGDELCSDDDPNEVSWLVVGPTADGYYLTVFLKEYDLVKAH